MDYPGEQWKSDDSADGNWQEGFNRLDWKDQATIRDIADEKFNGDIVAAMKFRFKGNIAFALNGQMPKEWQLYSEKEREDLAKTRQQIREDSGFQKALEDLFTGLDGFDDDTELPPINKNSGPKKGTS